MTINNYTEDHERLCQDAVGHCGIKYMIYGVETGATGTPHLQCYFQANHDKFDRFKRYFGRTVHLEKQRADSAQARDYCKKDGDWCEYGAYEHIRASERGKRTDLEKVHTMIREGKSYDEIVFESFGTVAKYDRFIKDQIQERDYKAQVTSLKQRFAASSLRSWQQELMDKINGEPDPRKIMWYWDSAGNTGKSWMTTFLAANHGACVLKGGKKADMAYVFGSKPTRVVVFDLARTTEKFLDACYSIAEDMKNGVVCSTKYNCRTVLCDIPHVVFFANFEPDMSKWSYDRYDIHMI